MVPPSGALVRYGLAASTSVTGSWLYVSNQDSNDVTRYAKNDQNKPASAAPFFDAGKGNGVRGVAFDILNGLLFVADSDKDVVHAIDQSSGKEVWKLDVRPIADRLTAFSPAWTDHGVLLRLTRCQSTVAVDHCGRLVGAVLLCVDARIGSVRFALAGFEPNRSLR